MTTEADQREPTPAEPAQSRYDYRFWAIIWALCITGLLSALDASIISTTLPTIVKDLNSGSLYVWAPSSFFLAQTAATPIYGQTANIFGRRVLMIVAIGLFTFGSGIAGGASNTAMLIAGRVIQGIGGGGINVLVDMIVCDLVPLRERTKFMGIIFAVFGMGTTVGPIIGGAIVQHTTWRWVFYLNLPVSAVSLALIFFFLRVNYRRDVTFEEKLLRIDIIGNAILVTSVISILIPLTYGGTIQPWNSWRVVIPLVIGFAGLVAFHCFQASSYCKEPTMPLRLFSNRTSAGAFALTFMHGMLMYWAVFFLPVYFQAVLEASPGRSGVDLLPLVVSVLPFAITAGIFITSVGRYRPCHFVGFAAFTIGMGCCSILNSKTPTGVWVVFQLILGVGAGAALTSTLPAIQAPLPESDVATATATWGFVRSFGAVWGVAIPSAVFNSRVSSLLGRISDDPTRELLARGGAYERASKWFITSFNDRPALKSEVIGVYSDGLKLVWQVGIGFSLLGMLIALFVKEVKMREELDTEFGLEEKSAALAAEANEAPQSAKTNRQQT
ncbi:hypothetical protein GP486_007996 [Trichoglossum hirsutum]|uniref:Major facilitator superfamily (MFS) profile domain-containing protein n=1 Tax=Trichoglossum hirsutum TaxID=265104 RepID=A0A9P8IJ28_9PEZI|nr:hypothetical protein GP486_007996 [Trichoglossum hirsutum]